MIIETRDHVNDRTADGRVYSAGQGAVSEIDDSDVGMVELMRDLERRGLVRIRKTKAPEAAQDAPPKKATRAASDT